MLKIFVMISCLLFGMAGIWFLNYAILDPILIPDPCAYHGEEISDLFDLFYSMNSWNGDHPFPTQLNFIFTLALGCITGLSVNRFLKMLWAK